MVTQSQQDSILSGGFYLNTQQLRVLMPSIHLVMMKSQKRLVMLIVQRSMEIFIIGLQWRTIGEFVLMVFMSQQMKNGWNWNQLSECQNQNCITTEIGGATRAASSQEMLNCGIVEILLIILPLGHLVFIPFQQGTVMEAMFSTGF